MQKPVSVALTLLSFALVAAPARPAEPASAATVAPAVAFVPVAIWEVSRAGYPTVRHAWVAGSDKMLRISWDDGATWFGFKPVFTDAARGLLAVSVQTRDEAGRGEVTWKEQTSLTVGADHDSRVTLPATALASALDVTLRLVEVREVSPSEIKPQTESDAAADAEIAGGGVPMAGGGGGGRTCCVACQGILACDCAVCIQACHTSCCVGGCFCPPC
jgi:hypothetical protein